MTTTHAASAHRIVVGIDGSRSSVAALDWALHQAELTGSSLEAITTWEWPTAPGLGLAAPSNFDPKADAQSVLGSRDEQESSGAI